MHRNYFIFFSLTLGSTFTQGFAFKTQMFRFEKVTQTANSLSSFSHALDSLQFGKFTIAQSQIFYQSPPGLSAAIVNLRPIVPGHVLIISKRVVPRLKDLSNEEYLDLWETVALVQKMLTQKYGTESFNVAVQDGAAAGQSVPHVHVHILPRKEGDFTRNDDVYDQLQSWAPTKEISDNKQAYMQALNVPEDADRRDRTMEEMENEASHYRNIMNQSSV